MAPHRASLFSSRFLFSREAPEQGGLLSGIDPTQVNTTDPLRLWIIQLVVIIATAQLLGLVLRKIRQPRVIAEVIGGIVLGPSIMGRIPHFTEHIFPKDSIPFLSLTANIGLVLFLFLVGLEIDLTSIRNNARTSLIIAMGGMILPFSIGAGMSKLIFDKFVDPVTPGTNFTHFMLFCCVAYSITAFPVLCRILTELKLLDTTVGVCVLSAGVGNDIVGWTLLALSVALVNASSGLSALYIILLAIGWAVFLLVPVKWLMKHFAKVTCREGDGPSLLFMTGTMMLVFGSAWFTDVIGVHAIFGGFLAGLAVPREGGLAITMVEKMEDMITIIFLPLYFTISGLSTNLGLLNTGQIWGYTIAIICTAWIGKFFGASFGARIAGSGGGGVGKGWRECGAVGFLMSCKGLVELIVLNVGLQAGILSTLVFSMFVLEALVLTFGTTPAVLAVYPPRFRVRAYGGARHEIKKDVSDEEKDKREHVGLPDGDWRRKFTFVLDRLEHVSGMAVMAKLLRPPPPRPQRADINFRLPATATTMSSLDFPKVDVADALQVEPATVTALRLIDLTDRTSAVMRSMSTSLQVEETDALLGLFRTFGALFGIGVRGALEVVSSSQWADTVWEYASGRDEDEGGEREGMVVIGSVSPRTATPVLSPQTPGVEESEKALVTPSAAVMTNPFERFFKSSEATPGNLSNDGAGSALHSHFIRSVFAKRVDVALFIDQHQHQHLSSSQTHVFLPFFGGPDDRLALEMLDTMCRSREVKATVIWYKSGEESGEGGAGDTVASVGGGRNEMSAMSISAFPDTIYNATSTATRLQSQTADQMTWDSISTHHGLIMRRETVPDPLHALIHQISPLPPSDGRTSPSPSSSDSEPFPCPSLVIVGRSRRLAAESHHKELKKLMEESGGGGIGTEARKTVGDVATALIVSGVKADLVVVQAGGSGSTAAPIGADS